MGLGFGAPLFSSCCFRGGGVRLCEAWLHLGLGRGRASPVERTSPSRPKVPASLKLPAGHGAVPPEPPPPPALLAPPAPSTPLGLPGAPARSARSEKRRSEARRAARAARAGSCSRSCEGERRRSMLLAAAPVAPSPCGTAAAAASVPADAASDPALHGRKRARPPPLRNRDRGAGTTAVAREDG